MNNLAIGR